MKQWIITKFASDLSGVELLDSPDPGDPGAGELLVDVGASGISITDLLLATGGMPGIVNQVPQPIGIEYAGTVRAVGDGVTGFAAGDRVCGMVDPALGSASQQLRVPAADTGLVPDGFSLEEAAALPVAYMTAHTVLHRQGNLKPGDRILITAAASGTGLAIVQSAHAAGAEVYGAITGTAKADAVRAAGATEVFDHTVDGWEEALPSLDVWVDTIGGASWSRSFEKLGPGGQLVVLDATSRHPGDGESDYGKEPEDKVFDPLLDLMFEAKSVTGIYVPMLWERDGGAGPMLRTTLAHVAEHDLRPTIAETFAWTEAVEALQYLQARKNVGRIVLSVGE